MKKTRAILLAIAVAAAACNNESKDSVEKADSANDANAVLDSSANKPLMTADPETSSFLVDAANGGMTEVQLGQMAQEKGTSQKVKDLASMVVSDHSAANDQVKMLAGQRSVTLPDSVGDANKKKLDGMSKKKGKDFDKAFVSAMVKDHESTVGMFEKAADKVSDAEVKTFINNTLPKLRMHLDSAKAVQKTIK